MAVTDNMKPKTNQKPTSAETQEARRREYIERVRESTRQIADRVRRSEQLTAEDFAVQINATEF
jgi:hypothetical protein